MSNEDEKIVWVYILRDRIYPADLLAFKLADKIWDKKISKEYIDEWKSLGYKVIDKQTLLSL